jgi:acetyltransferase-like isoleucine patch superfamily enzyme
MKIIDSRVIGYFILEPLRAVRRAWHRALLSSQGALVGTSVLIETDPGCDIVLGHPCCIGAGTILIAKQASGRPYSIHIGDDVAIHEYNNLRAAGGDITIGNHCQIAQHCTLVAANHEIDTAEYMINAPLESRRHSITIEDDVWIAANCVILPGVTIGRGAVVGAGTVVTKSVPPYAVVGGVPARLIRLRNLHA